MGASVSINNKDIAVIGMAFRFPGGVKNEKDFWSLLDRGQCAITKIPSSRWPTDLYQDDNRQMPGKSVSYNAGIIDNINESVTINKQPYYAMANKIVLQFKQKTLFCMILKNKKKK